MEESLLFVCLDVQKKATGKYLDLYIYIYVYGEEKVMENVEESLLFVCLVVQKKATGLNL